METSSNTIDRLIPNNLMAAAIGTGLLWFGWFGFNSGGALSAGALATKAFTTFLLPETNS